MATSSPTLPDQLQPQDQEAAVITPPAAASTSAWHSSGSIGPLFAVISVLTVLIVLSCLLGRICANRHEVRPLESIKHRSCFGWVKRKCRRCIASEESKDSKAHQDAAVQLPLPP